MAKLLAVAAAMIPLVILPGALFYFDITPKATLLLVATAVALPVFATSARDGLTILFALQLLSLCLSTALSAHPRLSLEGSTWRSFGLLTHAAVLLFCWMLARAAASDPSPRRWLLRAVTLSGCLIAAYGIAQYLGWDPWLPKAAYRVGEGEWSIVRPPATLGHAGYSATWLLVVLFFSAGLFGEERGRAWRWTAAAGVVLCGIAIVLSGTRAGLVGIAAGGIVLLARGWRPRRTVVAACVLAAAAFVASPWGQGLRSRARWSAEDLLGGARLMLWRDAARMGFERPLAGWGPETFWTEFPRRQSRELARAYPDFAYESPHNLFVEAWVTQGLPGLLILGALCGLALFAARQDRGPAGPVLVAMLASLQFTSLMIPTAMGLYLAIALLLSPRKPDPQTRLWTTPIAGVAIAIVLAAHGIRLLAADRALFDVRRHLDGGRLEEGVRAYDRRAGWSRAPDLWFSRRLAEAGRTSGQALAGAQAFEHAFQAARRATESAEDRHNAWYNLATFCALRNDAVCVEQSLRETIAWAPNWFKPHWTLAQVLLIGGRTGEAEREAALAVELNGARNKEVSETLEMIRRKGK